MMEMELLRAIGDLEDAYIDEMNMYVAVRSKQKRPRPFLLVAIIAVLMFAVTVGASGIVRWEDDSWFASFFASPSVALRADAISEHQLGLLDAGLVKLGQKVEQDGYTITLESALCDGHRLLAKLILEAPEGIVLEEGRYDIILDYRPLYPDGTRVSFGAMSGSFTQLEDPDTTDGMLQFLLDIRLQPDPDADISMLMGASWEITISEIQHAYSHEEEYWVDPLATGEWSFIIHFDEHSLLTQETEVLDHPVRMNAVRWLNEWSFPVDIRVTSLRIRALSATLTYDKPLFGFWHGIDIEGDIYVVMKDGTVILADWDMGHNKGGYWVESFSFPVPVVSCDVDHVLLPDGERIDIGE